MGDIVQSKKFLRICPALRLGIGSGLGLWVGLELR